jgi:uncharacterized heparinase superfamily protein
MTTGFVDEPRLAGLMLRETARRATAALRALVRMPATAEPLLAGPRDYRRADASVARAFYVGHVALGGHVVELHGRPLFQVSDEPANWLAELHSFAWLRHFTQSGDALSAEHARALVGDWLALPRRRRARVSREHETVARRAISWMTHAPIVLSGADTLFARRFSQALGAELRWLRRTARSAPDGLPRLRAAIAVALGTVCQPERRASVRQATARLAEELDRQIHPDGGHVSRNPGVLVAILADLLPLVQLLQTRNQIVPRGVFSALDRMLPALRFFRHADGALALFNGAGAPDNHLVAAILRHDESLGEPLSQMRQTGYQRLAAGRSVLIADTGLPPEPGVSSEAHAGTLSFEFSSAGRRLVVNCGAPQRLDGGWRRLSRTTAAHSTLTLNDHSSSRFSRSEALDRFLGGPLLPGPTRVPLTRDDGSHGQTLVAAHDGYRATFGFVHERQMTLSEGGTVLDGVDRLFPSAGRGAKLEAQEPIGLVRFHLHPDVKAERIGEAVRLVAGEEIWWFTADTVPEIEDSIFFADSGGMRRTRQITVALDCLEQPELAWRLERG